MKFKIVYEKVESIKQFSLSELIYMEGIDIVRDNDLTFNRKARMMSHDNKHIIFLQEALSDQEEEILILHELGHFYFDSRITLANKRMEERTANLFMCLFILKNNIWNCEYYQQYLINNGINSGIANDINEMIRQYKMTERYGHNWLAMEI